MEKVTPKLRFPEFEGKWDKSNLQDLSKKSISYGIVQTGNTIENGVPCLRVIDLTKDEIIVDDLITTSEKISNSYKKTILEEDELMIALRGVIGHTRIVTKNLVGFNLTRGIARVSPKKKIISPQFLLKYLNSPKCLKVFDQRKNGSALKEIPIGELRKILVEFPSLYEQQKIASFLTSVDERLTLLAQQKEKLELYKKGVMQQIFSQKLRFKDENGNTYPDWEEKKLGEIGEVLNGLTYSPDDISTEGVLVLRSSNVKNRILKFDDNVYVANKSFNPVQENDILICVRNGSKNLIGKNALINKNASGMAFGAFMSIYRSKYNNFIFHWFDTTQYKKIVDMNLGATINSINGSDLKKFNIPFPCLEEQQKIASFLSAIDVQIEGVSKKIEQTKLFKKGLLQQMFV